MDFSFDFSYLVTGLPVVTLSSLGLAFNRGSVEMLGSPAQIIVGYDEQKKAIGIRNRGDDATSPYFDFASRMKNDWVRIGAKEFLKYLSNVSGIDFISKSKQFIPEYDAETSTLIIVVDEQHLK